MNFKEWLLEETKTFQIYVDLDNTLIADHKRLKPHALRFIKDLERIGDVCVLTHGMTDSQRKIADSLSIDLPLIGRDKYHTLHKNPNAILIDDRALPDYRTNAKAKALGIGADRVITAKDDLERLLPKVKSLLEWVERNPQPVPKKQEFKTYNKARDMAETREDKFLCGMKQAAPDYKIVTDIKSKRSFKNKTIKRGKSPEKVFDVLRGAILVDNKNQIDGVVDGIKKNFLVKKVEHKTKPEEPFGYYGSVHVDVVVDDMICEIQIMTKKLWDIKQITDQIYRKYRGDVNPPEEEVEKSKKMFRIANGD